MQQYLDLLQDIKTNGRAKMDRTGVGCTSVFGRMLRFDLSQGHFPLLTTKKLHLKSIIHELLWFLSGDTNIQYLKENGVSIWDAWAIPEGTEIFFTPEHRLEQLVQAGLKEEYELWIAEEADLSGTPDEIEARKRQWCRERGIAVSYMRPNEHAGELGPVYGKMWRAWPNPDGTTTDQIQELVDGLINKPFSRRHIVSGWNPSLLPVEGRSHQENIEAGKQALPPCHALFQCNVEEMTDVERVKWVQANWSDKAAVVDSQLIKEIESGMYSHLSQEDYTDALIARNKELYLAIPDVPKYRLNSMLTQRSVDVPIGAPYNIASYALLTMMLAQVCGYAVGEFVYSLGDTHIYANQMEQVDLQLAREPRPLPKMVINPNVKNIFDFKYEDFQLEGYNPHDHIKIPVAV